MFFLGQVFQQCPAEDKTRNDPVLTARFSQIREAYEILGDEGQRAIYDSAGLQLLGGQGMRTNEVPSGSIG